MSTHLTISARDVGDAEAVVRLIQREARGLSALHPSMTALHFGLAAEAEEFEADIDLRFPQHQVVVNATAPTTERAVHDAVSKAAQELERLRLRDPSVA